MDYAIAARLEALGIDVHGHTSGDVKCVCPECSHTRRNKADRCLSVNVDEGVWLCHHCGYSGTVAGGGDTYGAVPKAERFKRPDYQPAADTALDPKPAKWLTERGITQAVWERNRIEYRRVWFPQLDGETMALCYPYRRGGTVVNVKYRDGAKHFRMERGAELLLYGEDDIAADAPLVWVEGEMDKLAVEVAGAVACVSVPNGAPSPGSKGYARHFDYLDRIGPTLAAVRHHVIATDGDAPGQALKDELVRRLGPGRCKVVHWPDGSKDANDVLIAHGADTLRACLDAARPVPVAGLFEVDDIAAEIVDLYERGLPGGLHPGSDLLAEHYLVKPGLWTLVTGIPGSGKSEWLNWVMVNLMDRHGWQFAVCSPENQPLARHAAQLLQIRVGRPFGQGPHARMTPSERDGAMAWLREHVTFILPDDDADRGYALDSILDLCKAAIFRRGVNGIVIDPWNELEHSRPPGMREDEHISQSLTKLRRFARTYNVHIWLVAHPRLMRKDPATQEYEVPTPYDVSGGAQFRNKADMAVTLYRHTKDDGLPVEVYVQKVRFRECGKLGMVPLFYDVLTGRYTEHGPITHTYETPSVRDPWETDDE